jgi:ferredoxin--NADP+ reductase
MFEIVERQELAQGTILSNWIEAPKIAAKAKPVWLTILNIHKKK